MAAKPSTNSERFKFPEVLIEETLTPVPAWMSWAAELGSKIRIRSEAFGGGLIVVTTPCQSVLPGAVALGYLLRQLEEELPKPDLDSHFEMLFALPPKTQVHYFRKGREKPELYELRSERDRTNGIRLNYVQGALRRRHQNGDIRLTRQACFSYQVAECAGAKVWSGRPHPGSRILQSIADFIPKSQNWQQSLGSISIVGPTNGNSSPRRHFDSCEFILEDETGVSLADVLAVDEWKASKHTPTYSRFISSARKQEDGGKTIEQSDLVILTSPEAYRRYESKLGRQVKVLVVSRDLDESKLEMLDLMLRGYLKDPTPRELAVSLPDPPHGIQLFALGEKPDVETSW